MGRKYEMRVIELTDDLKLIRWAGLLSIAAKAGVSLPDRVRP